MGSDIKVDSGKQVTERIAGAFKLASEATGTSFDYLLATSGRESDHRPELGSETSSAKGLFQFVDQTWLGLMKREGSAVGLERLAAQITSDGKGGWVVADPKEKAKILALKTDPLVASVMAGKFTQDNARQLKESLGRAPTDGELYAAHVLGAAGAVKLMRLAVAEPNTTAAVAFPRAAAANSPLFYGKGGTPRTAAQLLAELTRSRNTTADPTAARIAEAHTALSAQAAARKTDPANVALLIRAQAAALVGKEGAGAATATAPTAASEAADRRYARAALATTAMPGAAASGASTMPGGVGGWRAGASQDAFGNLMRSDPNAAAAGTAALAAGATIPGAARLPTDAAARIAAGGIPTVDPNKPMNLAGPTGPTLAAPNVTTVSAVPAAGAVPAARPSRLVAAANGAPDMPLPMVDAGTGAHRPSRLLFDAYASPEPGSVAATPGAVRVRTTTVTPPTSAPGAPATTGTIAAPRGPRLPPVPPSADAAGQTR